MESKYYYDEAKFQLDNRKPKFQTLSDSIKINRIIQTNSLLRLNMICSQNQVFSFKISTKHDDSKDTRYFITTTIFKLKKRSF